MADKKCIQQMTEIQKSSILKMPLQYSLHLHMNPEVDAFLNCFVRAIFMVRKREIRTLSISQVEGVCHNDIYVLLFHYQFHQSL